MQLDNEISKLIVYNKINIYLQKLWENEAGRLVPDLSLFFEKA